MRANRRGVTIITGGGTGLGRALAHRLTKHAHQPVLLIGRRLAPLLQTQSTSLHPHLVRVVAADIATTSGRQDVLAALGEEERVKALVQNAAILEPVGRLVDCDVGEEGGKWREHMGVNLEGPLGLTQALLGRMQCLKGEDDDAAGNGGRILHISSGAAHYPYRGWGPYCVSKSAFHMMYRVLASELSPLGIAVGSARPGVMDTPMQDLIRSKSHKEMPDVNRFRVMKEKGMLLDPETVARFLDWLLNDTNDVEFSENEWDVRDHKFKHRWKHYE